MRWTCQALGIPLVGNHHPLVWLDSTPLMRHLEGRTNLRYPATDAGQDGLERVPSTLSWFRTGCSTLPASSF